MVHKIHLPDFMEECPEYWQNFMKSFSRPPVQSYDDDAIRINRQLINNQLTPFNGWYISDRDEFDEECRLQFQSKEDAIFFVLRWS